MSDFRVSVSKTKTFLQCKKQYEFNYILKYPKKDHDFHIFGTFCHLVLETFHQKYIDGCEDPYHITITESYKNALKEYGSKMTDEMKSGCHAIIATYLKQLQEDKKQNKVPNVLAVEKRFALNVGEGIVLNGAIDRIQLDPDGIIHVGDYKTVKNKKYLNDYFQLLTYAYVLMSEDPTIDVIRASYILLRYDFEHLTVDITRDEALKIQQKYIDYVTEMINEKEFPPTTSILCRYCDFVEHCPAGKKMLHPSQTYGEVGYGNN